MFRMRWVLTMILRMKLQPVLLEPIDVPVCCIVMTATTFLLGVLEENVINHITLIRKG